MSKLINRIPGLRLLISSLLGSALRTLVESQASRCQQAFSKPCLVNLISKDTHLVFSICKILFQYINLTSAAVYDKIWRQYSTGAIIIMSHKM